MVKQPRKPIAVALTAITDMARVQSDGSKFFRRTVRRFFENRKQGRLMSTIIDTIFNVGQKLFGLRNELARARQERKQSVADFLASIAQTIEDASALLKQDTYPHGKCQELLSHSQHMEAAIGDLIGESQARELGAQLGEVYEVERLYSELGSETDPDRQRKLSVLDQAAGQFRATAAFVRVSP